MFQWDKTINAINIPASKVIRLFRSMRDVQLALPGVPAQQATAFLCQYQFQEGVGTAVVFHLHKSELLAFYLSEPRVVSKQKTDSMLDKGLNFVESMGFLMTDQDIHLLDRADREMLWAAVPLMTGLQKGQEESQSETSPVSRANVSEVTGTATPTDKSSPEQPQFPVMGKPSEDVAAPTKVAGFPPSAAADDNVDDLLAAVEAMRAKRPGLPARRLPPPAEEIERRRLQLYQTVGRILASL